MIEDSVRMGDLLLGLAEGLRDYFRDGDLKAQLFASMGEALFYVATQAMSESRTPDSWKVPTLVFSMLSRGTRKEEPTLVHQYVCKTIENVSSTSGEACMHLATHDNGRMLWGLLSKTKHAGIRKSCAVALCRLARCRHDLLQHVVDKAGM